MTQGREVGLPSYGDLLTGTVRSLAVDSGIVTQLVPEGGNTLTDSSKAWATDVLRNKLVKIIKGRGEDQLNSIQSNGARHLVVTKGWVRGLEAGDGYIILENDFAQIMREVFGGGADINAANPLQVYDPKVFAAVGLTTYSTRSAPATDVNGTTWKDLLDMTTLNKQEEIWSITLTMAGGWAGLCQVRIIDRAGNKIFPFADYAEENTDFFSGMQWNFPAPVVAPVADGYKVQFRSSNVMDGVGKTCTLTELPIIIRG